MAEAGAGRPFAVPQAAEFRVGDGGVGEDQLARGEAAGVALADAGTDAEESDLEAERPAVLTLQPAGGVPPFGAEIRVGAEIVGKDQASSGQHRRKVDCRGGAGQQAAPGGQGDEEVAALHGPHQSSRTASTASWRMAWRPASTAARAARAIMVPAKSSRPAHGKCRSMLQ